MKLKRVIAIVMSAALLVSAPLMDAGAVYAQQTESADRTENETGMGTAESKKDTDSAAETDNGKRIDPDAFTAGGLSGVKINDEIMPAENGTEPTEAYETEKSGSVTLKEIDRDTLDVDLLENEEGQSRAADLLIEDTHEDDEMVRVIIVMDGDSIIENESSANMNFFTSVRTNVMEAKQSEVVSEIEETVFNGEKLDIRYHYTWLLNGVATEVPYGMIDEIEAADGVEKVVLQRVYHTADETIDPYTVADGVMIGRDDTWADGYTGKGIVISIIDTGIDDDHQNFAALDESVLTSDSATKEKISSVLGELNASYIVPDITADDVYRSTKIAFGFNYIDGNLRINHNDSAGEHGTHVAGIAAANDLDNGEAVGVAPDAQLYIMKVFGAGGGAYTEDIVAALEDSLILGADVVNMSLGSNAGFTSEDDFLDEIYGLVSKTNTILAVAAGNATTSAQGNLWGTNANLTSNPDNSIISSPATYVNATSVASVDNVGINAYYIEAGGKRIAYTEGANGKNASMLATLGGGEYEYVMVDNFGQSLSDFTDADVEGKIAVVQRGVSAFTEKVQFAEDAGAIACLVYNNTTGTINMDLTNGTSTIPCASITMLAGETLAAVLAENPETKMMFSDKQAVVPSETGYRMSDFSSWGVAPNLSLEPDITAPGGNIYSTLDGGKYGQMSGTSMATPNVAGISALVMQYAKENFPELSDAELHTFVNSLLVSTSEPLAYDETTMFSPRNQGSGLANAYNAVKTGAYLSVDGVDVPKAELMDDPAKTGNYTFSFHVHNISDVTAYYGLDTSVQTEDTFYDEDLDKSFMSMTPIALDAVTSETSDSLIYTYDYNGNGKADSADARQLYLKNVHGEAIDVNEAFRYDLDGSEASDLDDVQAYLDALVDKPGADIADQILKVDAGSEAVVSVNVNVTDAGKNYMDSHFENGIYVEGFTTLTAKNASGIDLSLPYMGFYGDWTKAPILDSGYYWQEDDEVEASQYYNVIFTNFGNYNVWTPGVNPYFDEPFDPSHISISPNEDGYGDYFEDIYLSLLRNAKILNFTYTDAETGEVYYAETMEGVAKSYYVDAAGMILPFIYSSYSYGYDFTDADGNYLPNNTKLNFTISAELDYDVHEQNNLSDAWNVPITIDTEAPIVDASDIYVDEADGRRYLELTFHDNVAVTGVHFLNNSGTMILAQHPVTPVAAGESCTMSFDITGYGNKFQLIIDDYAFNERAYSIVTEDNDPILDDSLLYGYRVFDAAIGNDYQYGWICIDPETAETTALDSEYYMDYALTAAEYVGGYILAVDADNVLSFIKPGYWDERTKIADLGVKINEMAFDPSTNTLYAFDRTDNALCTIDIVTGELTVMDGYLYLIAMACDDNGTLYGIDMYGNLNTIDKATGTWGDTIAETADVMGSIPSYVQSMTYDSEENCIYWAYFNGGWSGYDGTLGRYDFESGKLEKIGTIGGNAEVVGLLKLDSKGFELPESEINKIALKDAHVSMVSGTAKNLDLVLTPWYGKAQEFYWTSADSTVAIAEDGVVYAVGEGVTTVTVSNEDHTLQASCEVTVVNPQSKLNGFVMGGDSLYNQWVGFQTDDLRNIDVLTEVDFQTFLAGEYLDGVVYAYNSESEFYRIDATTMEAKKLSEGLNDYIVLDMSYDYSSGYMYALLQDLYMGMTSLAVVDTLTGEAIVVGDISDEYGAPASTLAVSTNGIIYFISQSGILYTYDAATEAIDKIGYTGYPGSPYSQSMTFDHDTEELYWWMVSISSSSAAAGIMYVDTESGSAIPLGTIDGDYTQMTCLYSVPNTVPEREEVAVESVELTLSGNTLELMEGMESIIPVRVLPFNATDRTLNWTVEDESVAVVTDGVIVAKKAGSTKVTGTKTINGEMISISFELKVHASAGNLNGYIMYDLSNGNGQFWGSFKDNDLSSGEGLGNASGYEVYAGTYYDGKIYGYGVDINLDRQYMVINAADFTLEKAIVKESPNMRDMAFDYTQGIMYAVGGRINVSGNTTLYIVDLETGNAYAVSELDAQIATLACTAEGVLYGVSEEGGLYEINKTDGTLRFIGETGYSANLYQSMAYDYKSGNIYWAQAYSEGWQTTSALLLVNTENGSVTNLGLIGVAGSVVTSLYTLPDREIELGSPVANRVLLGSRSEVLGAGEQVQLTAALYPLSVQAADTSFTYRSTDETVASVDGNGLVTAVGAGEAEIVVTAGGISASCKIQVVSEEKMIYAVNADGWELSPLLHPDVISNSVELPDNADFTIATATYSNDGYFYAVDTEGYLWKYTEDLSTISKISADAVVNLLENADNFYQEESDWFDFTPQVKDIAANPYNGKVYVLVHGYIVAMDILTDASYIYELNTENGVGTVVAEISSDEMAKPDEFVFTSETDMFIYDTMDDYIYQKVLGEDSKAVPVAWAQGTMVAENENGTFGMAYSAELNRVYLATFDNYYNNGMTLFVFNPETGSVKKCADAAYHYTLVDLILIEGSAPKAAEESVGLDEEQMKAYRDLDSESLHSEEKVVKNEETAGFGNFVVDGIEEAISKIQEETSEEDSLEMTDDEELVRKEEASLEVAGDEEAIEETSEEETSVEKEITEEEKPTL